MSKRSSPAQSGQSAVELMLAIPIFMTFFLLSWQLFTVTWDAQYVHVRSRYVLMERINHKPCTDAADSQPESVTTRQAGFADAPYEISKTSVVKCE